MVIPKIKQLAAAREKLAQLERAVKIELRKELSALYESYGFADVKSFIKALRSAAGGPRKARKVGRPKKTAAPKIRKRAVITDAIRAKVKKLVKAGKSGSAIAKAAKISLPSVQNVKKALGITRPRKSISKRKTRKIPKVEPVQAAPEPAV